jgi:hypothetical protein
MSDNIYIVQNVEHLFNKGVTLKFHEKCDKSTMFKKRRGNVFVKGRDIRPKQAVDSDGWELKPLEFQDWWVDILVDGLCTYISIVREHTNDEVLVWRSSSKFFNNRAHLLPPPTLTYCVRSGYNERLSQKTLKIMALKVLEEEVGHNIVEDILLHTFDTEMTKAFKNPCAWWED